jgi:hypothetical protein
MIHAQTIGMSVGIFSGVRGIYDFPEPPNPFFHPKNGYLLYQDKPVSLITLDEARKISECRIGR